MIEMDLHLMKTMIRMMMERKSAAEAEAEAARTDSQGSCWETAAGN